MLVAMRLTCIATAAAVAAACGGSQSSQAPSSLSPAGGAVPEAKAASSDGSAAASRPANELLSYPSELDGRPVLVMVDMAYLDLAPIESCPILAFVSIPMHRPGPDGTGTREEHDALVELEKAFIAAFEADGAHFVGHVRGGGTLDVAFYMPAALDANAAHARVAAAYPAYQTGVEQFENPKWTVYQSGLVPSEERLEWLGNEEVVKRMIAVGDRLEVPRDVDHHLEFPTEAAREAFVAEATALGFRVAGASGGSVHLVRKDPVTLDHIHAVVMQLVELAKKHGGIHDGWGAMSVTD